MLVYNDINNIEELECSVITIGNFDGLHYAHQKIIKDVVAKANGLGCKSILITLEPHPLKYFEKYNIKLLQTVSQKLEIISLLGLNIVILLPFNKELANMSAIAFVEKILIDKLKMKHLFIGYNFQFGKEKKGDISLLLSLSKKYKFNIYIQEPIIVDGYVCNSTTIRNFIERGEIEIANKLLDRYYAIKGRVIKGYQRGQIIGYPTINIQTDNELLPLDGVYITYVLYKNIFYPSVTNIGFKPTFEAENRSIESYIIDFNKNLYDEEVQLHFIKRLRDEKKFDSSEKLIEQIIKDVAYARDYFNL